MATGSRDTASPAVDRLAAAGPVHVSTLALCVALLACGSGEGGATEGAMGTRVDATVAWRDTISVRVGSVGSLEAEASVGVRSETEGVVAEIPVREGDRVRRGQVLVRLDARELRARYEAATATLARAKAEAENLRVRLDRNESLLQAGAISPQAYDDLRTNYDLAVARVAEARANLELADRLLEKTVIRAPFAGTIGQRSFYIGDVIANGDLLFSLVDNDTLKVGFSLPERYATRTEAGTRTRIRVAGLAGQTFPGTVSFISPQVETGSRTVTLKAVVPNPEGLLRAGQFAEVEVELERRPEAVVLPETAIVPRSGQNFVFIVRDGTARRREVETGERERGLVEVLSGVSAGDTVVHAGQQRLQDGSPVTVSVRHAEDWKEEIVRERESL